MQQPPEHAPEHIPFIPVLILFGGFLLLMMALLVGNANAVRRPPAAPETASEPTSAPAEAAIEPTAAPTEAPVESVAAAALDPDAVKAGDGIFHTLCMACHGFNGKGIVGLGKSLVGTDFINTQTDEQLVAFMIKGREVTDPANTSGVAMPARGGNPALSDTDLYNVVQYIRSLNAAEGFFPTTGGAAAAVVVEPTAVPPTPTPSGPTPVPTEFVQPSLGEAGVALLPTAISPASGADLFASSSEALYVRACAACHGVDGSPVAFLATQPISASAWVQERNGVKLFEFLSQPQPPVNPEVAYPHPYRGGYPELTDSQILEVAAYLYTLR
jgi:disulfide bond formation protein DsbB